MCVARMPPTPPRPNPPSEPLSCRRKRTHTHICTRARARVLKKLPGDAWGWSGAGRGRGVYNHCVCVRALPSSPLSIPPTAPAGSLVHIPQQPLTAHRCIPPDRPLIISAHNARLPPLSRCIHLNCPRLLTVSSGPTRLGLEAPRPPKLRTCLRRLRQGPHRCLQPCSLFGACTSPKCSR